MTILTPERLEYAYRHGYFPMPHESGEIHWYRPNPRAIIPLDGFHVSRSLARTLKRGIFRISWDQDFPGVIAGCQERAETWITPEFAEAYTHLHRLGKAHSLEVWTGEQLAGGVYGVAFERAFFAESMFHRRTDASKVALFHLVQRLQAQGFALLECQFLTPHLASLGAQTISDREYMHKLEAALAPLSVPRAARC